jgi:hypothetical protein
MRHPARHRDLIDQSSHGQVMVTWAYPLIGKTSASGCEISAVVTRGNVTGLGIGGHSRRAEASSAGEGIVARQVFVPAVGKGLLASGIR